MASQYNRDVLRSKRRYCRVKMPHYASLIIASRLPLILVFNLMLWSASFALAVGLRFDWQPEMLHRFARLDLPLLLLLTFRSASYIYWKLNSGYWRYASTDDLERIVKAHAASSIAFAAAIWLGQFGSFPRSVCLIEFAFSILLCGGSRFFVRLACERLLLRRRKDVANGAVREVIVIGGGDSGHVVVKTLQSNRRFAYRARMILDDNSRLHGISISGVPIAGRIKDLPDILEAQRQISAVIVAIPSLSRATYDSISEVCSKFSVPVKRLQSFEDIALMDAFSRPDDVSIESILERDYTVENEQIIGEALRGRSVVVTGAAGSIGSELVRQILPFSPRSLVLIDNNEYHMYRVQAEVADLHPEVSKQFCIATVCDLKRIEAVLAVDPPDVLFHAAAYKHVPLMEDNVYEAFFNNVVGTRNLLVAAIRAGVKHFVLISTDKAVNSCSVMGHSKRLCELLVQSFTETAAANGAPTGRMTSAIVRFGNVINSNGSVLPRFREQIASGGPLTVTHPEMRRYFMSIREAVRLVLAAGTLGRNGEIFILEMGQPVKIVDVAQKMLALYGRRDIPVVFTGMRPGERLFEELTAPHEHRSQTTLSKVDRVTSHIAVRRDIREWITEIESQLSSLENEEIARRMAVFLEQPAPGIQRSDSDMKEPPIAATGGR